MPTDAPSPHLLDAAKASALKLKEKQNALEARAKELDALKPQLDAQRADLENRAAKLTEDQRAIERERQGLEDVRASMERDLAAIAAGRDKLTRDEERLQATMKSLEDRERTIQENGERVARLEQAFRVQMTESESKLQGLLGREQELLKLQADWLAAFEGRTAELRSIGEGLQARQAEFVQQQGSLGVLKDAFKGELNRLLAEHEALATKEKNILEAEKYLASALQMAERDVEEEETPAPVPPTTAPPESAAHPAEPEPSPEPTPVAEAVAAPIAVPVQEENPQAVDPKA